MEDIQNINGIIKLTVWNFRTTEIMKGYQEIKILAKKTKPKGLEENIKVAHAGGQVAKNTRDEIENLLGEAVVTNQNKLNYQYIDEKEKLKNKK